MARWREPRPKSSPYITPEGERALKTELQELWLLRRKEVVPALSAAAAEGDRSENAEYHAAKEQQGFIEARIKDIEGKLSHKQVIEAAAVDARGKVIFGATVVIQTAVAALVLLPPELVRYLFVHELCHLLHMSHSRAFWRTVARFEPGEWELADRAAEMGGPIHVDDEGAIDLEIARIENDVLEGLEESRRTEPSTAHLAALANP